MISGDAIPNILRFERSKLGMDAVVVVITVLLPSMVTVIVPCLTSTVPSCRRVAFSASAPLFSVVSVPFLVGAIIGSQGFI